MGKRILQSLRASKTAFLLVLSAMLVVFAFPGKSSGCLAFIEGGWCATAAEAEAMAQFYAAPVNGSVEHDAESHQYIAYLSDEAHTFAGSAPYYHFCLDFTNPCCTDPDQCCGSPDVCCGNIISCQEPPHCEDEGSGGNGVVGKPIALVSGAESFARTDLTIGNLYPISLERRYNSRSTYDSPLGYAWALTYDKRLYNYPDGSVSLRKECGKKKRYKWKGSASGYSLLIPENAPFSETKITAWANIYNESSHTWSWVTYSTTTDTPQDKSATLVKNTDGSYTIMNKYGEREDYDTKGRLARQTAPNGNAHVFTYESVFRDPILGLLPANIDQNTPLIVAYDYRLSRIEEKNASGTLTGAWVEFYYETGSGWLTQIVDSAGRAIMYTHDSIGNLTGVAGPNGTAAYGYNNTANRRLLTNIDEGQGEYVNTYNAKGKVVKQTHGTGEINITYPTPYSAATATTIIRDASGATLNTQTRPVQFGALGVVSQATDEFGNRKVYAHDSHGWLTQEARYDNNNVSVSVTNYTYDSSLECTQTDMYRTTCSETGPGKGNLLRKTEAVGTSLQRTTTYTYHPVFGLKTSETVSSVVDPTQNKVTTSTYDDANGNLLTTTETGLLGDNTAYSYTTTYTYDTNGKVTSIDGPRTDVQAVTTYSYDQTTGFLLSMTQPIIGTTTYSNHDALGNPQTVTDPNGNSTTYTYCCFPN